MYYLAASLLLITLQAGDCTYSPVVIVPGAGGNQLEGKLYRKATKPAWYCATTTKTWFLLWMNISSLLPFQINCWVDNIRLEWNMKDMSVNPPSGVQTRVPGFAFTERMETIDSRGMVHYMKPLADRLRGLGYRNGKNLHGAPYDFRYSPENLPGYVPDEFRWNIQAVIKETYDFNNNTKVTIISHGYGCAITQYFLSQQSKEWKEKYVKQWIPLSGVFGGTKQAVLLYSSGLPQLLMERLKLRGEQRSHTSNLWMLPSLAAWPGNDVIAKTSKRTYRISNMDEFLKDIGFPEGAVMRHHISNSSYMMSKAPGVPIHCFHGNIAGSTIERLEFENDFPDKPSKIIKGSGDGTVNLKSLQLCGRFSTLQKEIVTLKEVEGISHDDIVSDNTVLDAIEKLL